MKYKCLYCNKNYQQKFVEKLKERFLNTHKYFLTMITKIVLLLQKGVFSYEYMNDCVKFNETSLPGKKIFKATWIRKILLIHITRTQKDFVKILKQKI